MTTMKKFWTLPQVARDLSVSKQRAQVWHDDGRLPHDMEDQEGRPAWSRLPKKPMPKKPGRK